MASLVSHLNFLGFSFCEIASVNWIFIKILSKLKIL